MLALLISPLPISFDSEDFIDLGEVQSGKDRGKKAYLNKRWAEKHRTYLFESSSIEDSIPILSNEVLASKNLYETLCNWVDPTYIVTLTVEEVEEFATLYSYTNEDVLLKVLTTEMYDKNTTVAKTILLNGLDILVEMSRRESGEK